MNIPPWLHLFDAISGLVHSTIFIVTIFILWKAMRINAEAIARINKALAPILLDSVKKNKIKNKKK